MATYVIGIDPSSSINSPKNCIGFSVFRDKELIEIGEIDPDPLTGFTRVRRWVHNKAKMIRVKDPNPTIIFGCETAFLNVNPVTGRPINPEVFRGLVRAISHIEAASLDESCSFKSVSPQQSFTASTGLTQYPLNDKGKRKGTRKPAIQAAVKERYHLPEDTSEHICDACAISEAILQEIDNGKI